MTAIGALRRVFLGISTVETTFARRGFRARSSEAQSRLEQIGSIFVRGYHSALELYGASRLLEARMNSFLASLRGEDACRQHRKGEHGGHYHEGDQDDSRFQTRDALLTSQPRQPPYEFA